MTTVPLTQNKLGARERLLAAADELFYAEGVHTVGIDRVIERAGVAKASLYNTFGSKDELVRAYLSARQLRRQARIATAVAQHDDPRAAILGVFDLLDEIFAEPGFRGCAFLNASAESRPEESVDSVCSETRGWIRAVFADLARTAGAADPDELAGQLVLLYDGATVSAQLDRNKAAARTARAVAAAMVDAATG
ncbi:TetR/AcrR family transcriptional regulator [Acidothermaceae bacterium B102]|nr:TetR/AcrR family transcriptional regulator [Acidothermaceae bacterium B102]